MRKYRVVGLVAALLALYALAVSSTRTETQSAGEELAMAEEREPMPGGIHDAPEGHENDLHVLDLARFAVSEHNKKANAQLEFEKVVKVKQQVVAGMIYYLTIEVKEGDAKKLYEAKVWEKLWMDFKELQEFKPAEGGASA